MSALHYLVGRTFDLVSEEFVHAIVAWQMDSSPRQGQFQDIFSEHNKKCSPIMKVLRLPGNTSSK
jgi:hypothetical protein